MSPPNKPFQRITAKDAVPAEWRRWASFIIHPRTMKSRATAFTALAIGTFTSPLCAEQSEVEFPTHCKLGEVAYLNAKMATIEWRDNAAPGTAAYVRHKNGKLLSLCADREHEPLGNLVYRYGAIGKVEFERTATIENKFYISYEQGGPRGGENIFFFHTGDFTYYVTEAVGDGRGIGIHVFKAGNRVSYLFSGNDVGTDYVSGLFPVSFEDAISPIFSQMHPEHNIWKLR